MLLLLLSSFPEPVLSLDGSRVTLEHLLVSSERSEVISSR
jgi:hypothetical protein